MTTTSHASRPLFIATLSLVLGALVHAQAPTPQPPAKTDVQITPIPNPVAYQPRPVEMLRAEAAQVMPLITSVGGRRFLFATNFLLVLEEPRIVLVNPETRDAIAPGELDKVPADQRDHYQQRAFDEEFYYYTKYGSPIAYARALDLACAKMLKSPGDCFTPGRRVLDFGYGGIGHLRNLACLGMQVVGVDVDPLLKALYSHPEDTGKITGALQNTGDGNFGEGPPGILTLVQGRWPGDPKVREQVGDTFDLIISKNTLKRGYIHPEKPVPDTQTITLGVEDDAFVKALADSLRSEGVLMIYNICPAQKKPDEGYLPWADGRCPFPRELLEKHGFEVLAYDMDDSAMIRKVGEALKWNEQGMDLQNDLFAWYTLAIKKKPDASKDPKAPATPATSPKVK